jgi:hypothetical protein
MLHIGATRENLILRSYRGEHFMHVTYRGRREKLMLHIGAGV